MNLLILGSLSTDHALGQIQPSGNDWDIYQHDFLLTEEELKKIGPHHASTFDDHIYPEKHLEINSNIDRIYESVLPNDLKLRASISHGRVELQLTALLLTYEIANSLLSQNQYEAIYLGIGAGLHLDCWKTLAKSQNIPLHILDINTLESAPDYREAPRAKPSDDSIAAIKKAQSISIKPGGIACGSSRIVTAFAQEICDADASSDTPLSIYPQQGINLSARDYPALLASYLEAWKHRKKFKNLLETCTLIPSEIKPLVAKIFITQILSEYPKALTRAKKAQRLLKAQNHALLLADTETGKDTAWAIASIDLGIPILGFAYDAIPSAAFTKHYQTIVARSESAKTRLIQRQHDQNILIAQSHKKLALLSMPAQPSTGSKKMILALGTWSDGSLYQSQVVNYRFIEAIKQAALQNPNESFIIKLHPVRQRNRRTQKNNFLGVDDHTVAAKMHYAEALGLPENVTFAPIESSFYDYIPECKLLLNIESIGAVESMAMGIPTLHFNHSRTINHIYPQLLEYCPGIQSNDKKQFADIVTRYLSSDDQLKALATQQKDNINSVYWPDADNIIDLASQLVQPSRH